MTQITGKIYQQTNAAGTENRFPRTVMEAVLGLNSYLQDQFDSLADIYMPIEGISESKPNQEFVFRKTPNTIKAKALTLDKIKGKTLAWNQLVRGLTLGSGVYNGLTVTNNGDGTYTFNGTTTGTFDNMVANVNVLAGHKYFVRLDVPNVNANFAQASFTLDANGRAITTPASDETRLYITMGSGVTLNNVRVTPQVTDLTLMFGAGNEPSTVEEFEALFPQSYYAYNEGTLISNKADSIETVGFNQWDEELEIGDITFADGRNTPSISWIRNKGYIPCLPNTTYYIKCQNVQTNIYFYDNDFNYLGRTTGGLIQDRQNKLFQTPNCSYMRFASNTTTYNHDICINISDPAKNGTYEPYRKRTLHLGLNNIRVKSHNIWDEEWELGAWIEGVKEASTTRICSKNKIPVKPSTTYYIKGPSSYNLFLEQYGSNGAYITRGAITFNVTFTTGANTYFVTISPSDGYGVTYNNNICLNVSNASFNGQYEPHGVLTINGVKSAGSVYDEIYSNKFIKRIGEVDLGTMNFVIADNSGIFATQITGRKYGAGIVSIICSKYPTSASLGIEKTVYPNNSSNQIFITDSAFANSSAEAFKAAMSGVMNYYELATPIEYDLAEPIPMSMPAGTTEARISPNADGLSAPFCCDITYGMGATEYAETAGVASFALNAQYAEVAARLLTPRTIWGQVFDGSANITGAMTGVSAIDSLMHFDTANGRIGIGISTPLYSLDVAGTFRVAGNSYIGGNVEIHGNINCGGQMEINALTAPDSEFDSEHSINIPLWRLEEDGEAEFGNIYIRDLLKLRAFYNDDGTFHDATMQYEYDDEDASNCFISADKSIHAPSFVQSSDIRLKTDLQPIALTVEQIASAPAVEFNWVGNGQRGAGSIAQYWQEQLPYNVHRNGDLLSMEYGNIALISAIVCARKIQELEEQVKKLEEIINNK